MWTSDTGAPYMVLTAHWTDNEWNIKHAVIAFQRFPHPHTGLHIEKATFNIFQDFSIATKALSITIDNGSNQVLAMNLLTTTLSKELQVEFNVIRCGAHTIALVVNAGLGKLKTVIDKVREFVIEVRKSPKKEQELLSLAQKFNIKYRKLIRDVKTRWNSTYSMLEAFLSNKSIIVSIISMNDSFTRLNLNDSEWKEIQSFCNFLQPFFEFTEAMSGSEYSTLGTLLLLLDHLLEHLITTTQNNEESEWIRNIAETMITKFNSLYKNLYNSTAYLALVLDPRYKIQIIPNSVNVETIKELLSDKFYSYKEEFFTSVNTEINEEENIGVKRKGSGILEKMLQKKKKSNNLRTFNEIDEYLSVTVEPSNINPCDWWKHHQLQYPILSKIAKDYISIPATSVPSEQAFSKSGELINKRRNRLGDSSIEACMCLNSWLKLENN